MVHTVTKTSQAPNLARSAIAPEISAPVMTQNSPWKTAKRIVGMPKVPSASGRTSDSSPRYCTGLPISPPPTSSPNASEYPTSVQATMTTPRAPTVIIIMLRTLLARTMPP